jgi:hypothetical protein
MPLPTVTPADLKARYPVFKDQPDTLVQLMLEDATGSVSDTWIVTDQKPALLAYAAHLLALETFASNLATDGSGNPVAITGPMESIEVGDVKVKYARQFVSEAGATAGASGSSLASTPYGRRYLELLRKSNPGILVV